MTPRGLACHRGLSFRTCRVFSRLVRPDRGPPASLSRLARLFFFFGLPTSAVMWILSSSPLPPSSRRLPPFAHSSPACRPADGSACQMLLQLRVHPSLNGREESKSSLSGPSGGALPPPPPSQRSVGLAPQFLLARLSDLSKRLRVEGRRAGG